MADRAGLQKIGFLLVTVTLAAFVIGSFVVNRHVASASQVESPAGYEVGAD